MIDRYNMSYTWNDTMNFHPGLPWSYFIKGFNKETAKPDAIDLLSQMLVWDFVRN